MKLGLQVRQFDWPGNPGNIGPTLAAIGRAADAAGFESLWVMDHFFQMDMPQLGLRPEHPMLESYSALNFLAAVTERIRLGAMVTGVNYRHPGHLLKLVSTLDVLSGGRGILGIGAGWYEREAIGLGFPFPPLGERFECLEETLQIVTRVWSGNTSPFDGIHYQLAEPMDVPSPLSSPRPPILIGGGGEKKTLRLVAQYADACNFFVSLGNEELARKLDILKEHCDAVGRDYTQIQKTVLGQVYLGDDGISAHQFLDILHGLANIGIETYIFSIANVHEIEPIEIIGREIIPVAVDIQAR
ncbi:MAG: LLM class F420-dependent oxidoreductase [Caldilineaceae bacterium]|jgi:F420-dependent oxidoreductase-like protein